MTSTGVLATPKLNGDYLFGAAAVQVGGWEMAPGAHSGDGYVRLRGRPRHLRQVRRSGQGAPRSR